MKIARPSLRQVGAFALTAVVGVIAGATLKPVRVEVREVLQRTVEWKPGFCASIVSHDNIPVAVCDDYIRPIYFEVPEGYVGKLEGCVVNVNGGVRECRAAKNNKI